MPALVHENPAPAIDCSPRNFTGGSRPKTHAFPGPDCAWAASYKKCDSNHIETDYTNGAFPHEPPRELERPGARG